jgi:hypothetical protein
LLLNYFLVLGKQGLLYHAFPVFLLIFPFMPKKMRLATACFLLALPAQAQIPSSQPVTFSPALDRRISQAAAASNTPCDLQQVALSAQTSSGAWSAWQTDYCLLGNLLVDPAYRARGSYPVPVRLLNTAGRQLFLAGYEPTVLLEFAADRFRFIDLGDMGDTEGSPTVWHQFYPHPEGDLLQIRTRTGGMGKAGGAVATWLSMLDIEQGKWVLADVLIGVEEDLGIHDQHEATRFYQVQEGGRTLVLGKYRLDAGPYQYPHLPAAVSRPEEAEADLSAGTYHLLAGKYERVQAVTRKQPALKSGRRLAVGAAEVNGTFRDGRGREFNLLAIGAGKVQVAYQAHPTPLGSRLVPTGQALIQADSALYTAQGGGCPLRLYFVRAGTLVVQAPTCPASGVTNPAGTYQKVSSLKPQL